MTDHSLTHTRKAGVRFIETDSTNKDEENPLKIRIYFLIIISIFSIISISFQLAELQWEESCNNQRSFDLYFGILKLSHSYTMIMDVAFHRESINLESIVEHQHTNGLQLLVTELRQSHSKNRTNFQVEIIIHRDSLPGPFHRTFFLCDKTNSKSVLVNVRGKILREGQGTATLRDGVHMKSLVIEGEEDDE